MLSSKKGHALNLLIMEHTKLTQNVTTYENLIFLGTAVHGFVLKKSKVIDFLFKKRFSYAWIPASNNITKILTSIQPLFVFFQQPYLCHTQSYPTEKHETEALYSYNIAKIKANPGVLSNSVFLGCCCIFSSYFGPLAG